MKRLIISLLLLSLSVGFCLFSYSFLEKKVSELDSELDYCTKLINEENFTQAKAAINFSTEFLNQNRSKFNILVEGDLIEAIEDHLNAARFYFEEEEYIETKSSLQECRNTLEEILESEKLSLEIIL